MVKVRNIRDKTLRAQCPPTTMGAVGEVSGSSKYYFVVVTHKRPIGFADTLQSALAQSLPPERVIVVDNSPDTTDWPALRPSSSVPVDYLPQPENLGFAGGLAVAIAHILELAGPDDWVCPDDMPLREADFATHSLRAANAVLALDPYTGAIGSIGAEVDVSIGKV